MKLNNSRTVDICPQQIFSINNLQTTQWQLFHQQFKENQRQYLLHINPHKKYKCKGEKLHSNLRISGAPKVLQR